MPSPASRSMGKSRRPEPRALKRARARKSIISICLGFAIVSCGEQTIPTASTDIAPPAMRPPSAMYAVDPGVDYADTWVSATQVITDTTVVTTDQSMDLPQFNGRVNDRTYAAACNCSSYAAGLMYPNVE